VVDPEHADLAAAIEASVTILLHEDERIVARDCEEFNGRIYLLVESDRMSRRRYDRLRAYADGMQAGWLQLVALAWEHTEEETQ
jgi:hypothetical protein